MKTLILISSIFFLTSTHAQEWKKYSITDLGLWHDLVAVDWSGGGRHFKFNPYTNTPWMSKQMYIQTIATDGSPKMYKWSNTPIFESSGDWIGFEFTENNVLALDKYYGLYSFENDVWTHKYATATCNSMTFANDTFYILRNNQPMLKWSNEIAQNGFNFGTASRVIVNEDRIWISSNFGSPVLWFLEGTNLNYYDPDTSLLMDYGNYDFKYSPHKDTLYVSGDKGLSMAHNFTFFDSIAPDNTTNMPSGIILDFEFDSSDNIWALFGSDYQTPTAIAHYDQPTKTWDAFYDDNNSALEFNGYSSIELDTFGNVWMASPDALFVLELFELPSWLATKSIANSSSFDLYPNPTNDVFQIRSKIDAEIKEVIIYNVLGEKVLSKTNSLSISTASLSEGCYTVHVLNALGEVLGVKKLIVH